VHINTVYTRADDAGLKNGDAGLKNADTGLSRSESTQKSRDQESRVSECVKARNTLSSPSGQVAGVRSRSQARDNGCDSGEVLATRLRNLSKGSRDPEVTPHCSIRPPPFDDVLVV
jgi:hypothetical protein